MNIGRSGNPTLNENTFRRYGHGSYAGGAMTLDGTVNKAFITLAILLGAAFVMWFMHFDGRNVVPYAIGGAIGGLVLALIISFKPSVSPVAVPIYAALEGLFIGAISAAYESRFEGITLQAVMITFGVFIALLLAYKTRIIRATENFKLGVFAATMGIAIVYLINFILSFFGHSVPFLHDTGWIGIGVSLVIVTVAALNLVLDFDFIESGTHAGAPKYMEWYGAFGLLVTLVWLYLEILRLLAKLRSRN
ncbi:Bax inhibitor-1/YccA family protein [Paenibacillus thermoaerophilus]|uniref:Bax inhibitor-1/YccA family protein n=1 Tax=Paenibacillus thermoaerophilus TaxID=1215385 RepID=A0ABW2V411_9BACL|nr:Bax inhibitor-1/YccA family protein [Paenibacillus thermoaerophilus]TMV18202.1 Bax inhibitor-1/YccA family protein [Paenibacillus thermoaerophilus]